jgi:predicted DNA-binding antitoxin AbrB/MazE fold protein
MSFVVEGVYERGIVKLKNRPDAPDRSDVLVIFKNKKSKKSFLKAAGSGKNIDGSLFEAILNSRNNIRERGFEF